jgi:outer membrane protease
MKTIIYSLIFGLVLTACQSAPIIPLNQPRSATLRETIGSPRLKGRGQALKPNTGLSGSGQSSARNANYDENEVSADFMTGSLSGHTTYKIDFQSGVSQLEFPLDSLLFGIDFRVKQKESGNNWPRWSVGIKSLMSLAQKSGKMKDSDWLTNATDISEVGQVNSGLDIYSESTAKLFAQAMEINGVFNVFRREKIALGVLVGYIYQSFEYDVSDVRQSGFGAYAPLYTGTVSGDVLDYEVEYRIPYLGINSEINVDEKLGVNLQFGYSSVTQSNDSDDHLLRGKVAEGDCQGNAVLFKINTEWAFQPRCVFQVNYSVMKIDTRGKQSQYWYANDPAGAGDETGSFISGIDDRITSMQQSVMAGIRISF